jgi:NIPSNAP
MFRLSPCDLPSVEAYSKRCAACRAHGPLSPGLAGVYGPVARCAIVGAAQGTPCQATKQERKAMLYELRIYNCLPGRLPALLKRFETATLNIWETHGIRPAGFWTVQIGEGNNDLYYFLAWESLAEREQKWTAFQSDPKWISVRAESERDGPILANVKSMILQPTAFSTVK